MKRQYVESPSNEEEDRPASKRQKIVLENHEDDDSFMNRRRDLIEEVMHFAEMMSSSDKVISLSVFESVIQHLQENIDEFEELTNKNPKTYEEMERMGLLNESVQVNLEGDFDVEGFDVMREAVQHIGIIVKSVHESYERYLNGEESVVETEIEREYMNHFGDDGKSYLTSFYPMAWRMSNHLEFLTDDLRTDMERYDESDLKDYPLELFKDYDERSELLLPLGYDFDQKKMSVEDLQEIRNGNHEIESNSELIMKHRTIDWDNLNTGHLPFMQLVEYLITHLPERVRNSGELEESMDDLEYTYVSDDQYDSYLKLLEVILKEFKEFNEGNEGKEKFAFWSRIIVREIIDRYANYHRTDTQDGNVLHDIVAQSESESESEQSSDDESSTRDRARSLPVFTKRNQRNIPVEVSRRVADNYLYTIDSETEEENPIVLQHWKNPLIQRKYVVNYDVNTDEYDKYYSSGNEDTDSEEEDGAECDSIHRDLTMVIRRAGVKYLSAQSLAETLFSLREYLSQIVGTIVENMDTDTDPVVTKDHVIAAISMDRPYYPSPDNDDENEESQLVLDPFPVNCTSTIDEDLKNCSIRNAATHDGRVQLFVSETDSDVTLTCTDKVNNREWKKSLHREILSLRCTYFKAMFTEYTDESKMDCVDMTEYVTNSTAFELLLYYLYTDELRTGIEAQLIVDVCAMSNYFLLDNSSLMRLCEHRLWEMVNLNNIQSMIDVCRVFHFNQLFAGVEAVIVKNNFVEEIADCLDWLERELFTMSSCPITNSNVIEKLTHVFELIRAEPYPSLLSRLQWWRNQFVWYMVRQYDVLYGTSEWDKLPSLICPSLNLPMHTVIEQLYHEWN